MVREPDAATRPAPQDNQLMSKHCVLSLKSYLRLEWRGQDGQSEAEQPDHPASLGDSNAVSHSDEVFGTHSGYTVVVRRALRGLVVSPCYLFAAPSDGATTAAHGGPCARGDGASLATIGRVLIRATRPFGFASA
jgi:hypothetical protein